MKQLYLLLCLFTMLTAPCRPIPSIPYNCRTVRQRKSYPSSSRCSGPTTPSAARDFKLFLRSSPETLAQVKQMISNLDVAAKMLQISVFQGNDRDLRALGVSGNVQVQSGDANVSIGSQQKQGQKRAVPTSVTAPAMPAPAPALSVPVGDCRTTRSTSCALPRAPKAISKPANKSPTSPAPAGGDREAGVGVDYKDVTTGFYVLPRIHGDQVTMDVSPFKQSQSKTRGGDINTQSAKTTITGRMGEWLPIGGTTEQTRRSRAAPAATGQRKAAITKASGSRQIWFNKRKTSIKESSCSVFRNSSY